MVPYCDAKSKRYKRSSSSFDFALAEGERFEYAFALLNSEVAASLLHVELPLQLRQPAHDDLLHFVGPLLLRLALLPRLLQLHYCLLVLLLVAVVSFLQAVHLFQQQLVLILQVMVLALQDSLNRLVVSRSLNRLVGVLLFVQV
jgi:hypothetical protein